MGYAHMPERTAGPPSMSTAELQPPSPAKPGLPRQIPYIIGNEACERFSFYGMRNILTPFLVTSLLLYAPEAERAGIAKDVFHTFVIGVYFFPLLGGWLADRFFGKYNTDPLVVAGVLRGPRVPRAVRRQPHGLLHRPVPDRAGLGRHQAAGRVVRRRPVRPDEQAPREGRLRRVLLDHQLRLVLRVAADADLPAQLRAGGRVRHPRHPDVHRDGDLLGRAARSTCACRPRRRPALVPARRAHRARRAQRQGRDGPGSSSPPSARALAVGCVRDDRARCGFVAVRLPRARCSLLGVRRHRRVAAARSRARGASATMRSTACARCCAS